MWISAGRLLLGLSLASINWFLGVNRSALVRAVKTLTDPRALRIGRDSLKNRKGH